MLVNFKLFRVDRTSMSTRWLFAVLLLISTSVGSQQLEPTLAMDSGVTRSSESAEPSTDEVKSVVTEILEDPDFGGFYKRRTLRLKESDETETDRDWSFLKWLEPLLDNLGTVLRFAVYLLAGCIVVFVVWALLNRLPEHWRHRPKPSSIRYLDVEHHPLTRSLPTDIANAASQAMRLGKHREALSLLYRGALRSVMRRHGFSIPESATEQECELRVSECQNAAQSQQFSWVVSAWTQVAYARAELSSTEIEELIQKWTTWFEDDSTVNVPTIETTVRTS